MPKFEKEENIAADLMEFSWMDKIKFDSNDGIIFLSAGVFYWLETEDMKSLISEMARRFPKGRLTFDNESPAIMKKGNKVMKKKGIEVEMKFILNDPDDIMGWSDCIKEIRTIYDFSSILPDRRRIPFYAKLLFKYMEKKKGVYQTIIDFK